MKKLSFWQATAIGLGNIVGAGIFVLAGSAINAAGPSALIAFLITATLAMTVGLNNAELASKIPNVEGGVYSFAKATLGDTIGFLVGWFRLISYAISGAAVALGFSGYFINLGLPEILHFPVAILLILILSLIEIRGLRFAARAEEVFVIINISSLLIFIGSVLFFGRFTVSNFNPFFPHDVWGLLVAANIAFFAYSGFNTIATLTPDVQDGDKTVPKAIIFSLITSCLLYLVVVFSMLFALNWNSYGTTANPLSLALSAIGAPQPVPTVVAFSAIVATFTVTLSLIVAGSRVAKQMGDDGSLPKLFRKGSGVPTMVIAGIMLASLGLGNVGSIALVANFGIIFSYTLSGLEVIIVRRRLLKSRFISPGFPYIQILSVILSIIMLVSLGEKSLMVGTVTLLIGFVIHVLLKEFKQFTNSSTHIR